MVRHAGAAPAPAVWKTAVLAVTPMTHSKVVAVSGIVPDSPRLQQGANLSQLNSLVPPRGIAPRSIGYRPIALLLSYEGMNGSPDEVTLLGLPDVSRPFSF